MSVWEKCPVCDGQGTQYGSCTHGTCGTCNGHGIIMSATGMPPSFRKTVTTTGTEHMRIGPPYDGSGTKPFQIDEIGKVDQGRIWNPLDGLDNTGRPIMPYTNIVSKANPAPKVTYPKVVLREDL